MIDEPNEKQGTTRPMNEASQWRYVLARQVAPFIAANPDVQTIMLAGSTSRGNADRYSDVEIGVFWSRPPSDEERMPELDVQTARQRFLRWREPFDKQPW